MSHALAADEWIARAVERAENAVFRLRQASLTTGLTGDTLRYANDQLRTASEHLHDAAHDLGVGDLR